MAVVMGWIMWIGWRVGGLFVPLSAADAPTQSQLYLITFESTWSAQTHPHPEDAFPDNAHFSPLIGALHNGDVSFWRPGGLASPGIEQMAETGGVSLLRDEIDAALAGGTVHVQLSGIGLADTPGSVTLGLLNVPRAFDRVTLVTMIAPSPDWFVGVSGLSLLDEDGAWVDQRTVVLDPYDAGTDSGADYTAANADTQPPEPIHNLSGSAPFSQQPIGTLTFERVVTARPLFLPIVRRP